MPVKGWKWGLAVVLVGACVLGVIVWKMTAWSGGPEEEDGSAKWIDIGEGVMLVRIHLRVTDAEGIPVAGARVVSDLSRTALESEEAINDVRRMVDSALAEGFRGEEQVAIATTDQSGVAVLEYTSGRGGEIAWIPAVQRGEFPFAWWVRVDAPTCGTLIRPLNEPRNIRFDLHPGPVGRGRFGEIKRVGEADFEIRCEK